MRPEHRAPGIRASLTLCHFAAEALSLGLVAGSCGRPAAIGPAPRGARRGAPGNPRSSQRKAVNTRVNSPFWSINEYFVPNREVPQGTGRVSRGAPPAFAKRDLLNRNSAMP